MKLEEIYFEIICIHIHTHVHVYLYLYINILNIHRSNIAHINTQTYIPSVLEEINLM